MDTTVAGSRTPLPDSSHFPRRAFIDGAFTDAASGATFACVSPISGESLFDVAACDAEDVDRAVAGRAPHVRGGHVVAARAARAPQGPAPARRPDRARPRRARADDHARHGQADQRRRRARSGGAAACFRYFAEAVDKVYGEVGPTGPSAVTLVTREPIGVVGLVVPWNYPLLMPAWKLAPALATGNSVVLKPAEQSPVVALALAQLGVEAGLPDGVAERRAGPRRDRRPGDRPPHGRRQGRVHRVERGREVLPRLRGRVEHEGRPARVRRQVPERGLRRRARRRPARWRRRRRASSATPARCAAPARGCCCRSRSPTRCSRSSPREAGKWQPGDPLDPATRMGSMVDEHADDARARLHRDRLGRGRGAARSAARAREETAAGSSSSRRSSAAPATTCGSRRRRSSAPC